MASAAAVAAVVAGGPILKDLATDNGPERVPAAEDGGDPAPTTTPTTSTGQPTQNTVDEIAASISQHWQEPGYGKVVVDYAAANLRVYWKGTPPDAVARLDNTTVSGVTIELVAAQYSESELIAAGREAARLIEDRFGAGKVAATMPNETMSGLVVEIVRPWSGSVEDIQAAVGIPITVRLVDEGPVPSVDDHRG